MKQLSESCTALADARLRVAGKAEPQVVAKMACDREPRARLEQYLRGAYVRYSLRREGVGYRFDLPPKALKKRILFGGAFETREEDRTFFASLDVGPKFDLMAFLLTFGGRGLASRAQVQVSGIEW